MGTAHGARPGKIVAAVGAVLLGACSGGGGGGGGGGGTGAVNTAPSASAGADAALNLPSLAGLAGAIVDDGQTTVTVQWSVVSGPGPVHFVDATSAATQAAIPEEGTYVLRLTADDGEFVDSDEVTLTIGSAPGPMVDLAPASTFQTMRGWEATDDASHIGSTSWPNYKDALLDLIVDDLGVTRIRLEVRAGVENSRDYWQ